MKIDLKVREIADKAAEGLRAGKKFLHAINSALKEHRKNLSSEEYESLHASVRRELNLRSTMRRKKMLREKKAAQERRELEAAEMAFQRGDHLLEDL